MKFRFFLAFLSKILTSYFSFAISVMSFKSQLLLSSRFPFLITVTKVNLFNNLYILWNFILTIEFK